MVTDLTIGIDQVMGRPIVVFEGAPDIVVVVDGNGIVDLEVANRFADVVDLLFKGKFRRMNANDDKPLILVFFCPGADKGNGANAVDAGVGPEVDKDDLAT